MVAIMKNKLNTGTSIVCNNFFNYHNNDAVAVVESGQFFFGGKCHPTRTACACCPHTCRRPALSLSRLESWLESWPLACMALIHFRVWGRSTERACLCTASPSLRKLRACMHARAASPLSRLLARSPSPPSRGVRHARTLQARRLGLGAHGFPSSTGRRGHRGRMGAA